ncbi:hypothetical protein AAVH_01703 [Aphelenchoides avenae]|nr:hypothetical protein AAVH_01703 [Aphelenchus avenae]
MNAIVWDTDKKQHDWALLANQKLDSYERSVLESGGSVQAGHLQSLPSAFHYCFSLITTIGKRATHSPTCGGMLLGGIDVAELSFEAKMFSMIYTAIGIPLVMMYLAQCAKAITSILSGQNLFIFGVGLLFFTAILYDIFEAVDEDTVLYVSAIVSLSAFSVTFLTIQRAIEKRIGKYEMEFSRKYAQIERVISGDRLDTLDEDEKCDDSEYTSG